jgi:hypothetical protein
MIASTDKRISLYRIHRARFKINVREVDMRDLNTLLETVRTEAQEIPTGIAKEKVKQPAGG